MSEAVRNAASSTPGSIRGSGKRAGMPFPERLLVRRRYLYRIDERDCITYVSNDWLVFAWENDASNLARADVIGQSLWRYVAGESVREIYEQFFACLRRGDAERLKLHFRCDAPDRQRDMDLEMSSLGRGRIELCGVLNASQERPSIALLDAMQLRSDERVPICSWCKRVFGQSQGWIELEEAGAIIGTDATQPSLLHDVCTSCESGLRNVLSALSGWKH